MTDPLLRDLKVGYVWAAEELQRVRHVEFDFMLERLQDFKARQGTTALCTEIGKELLGKLDDRLGTRLLYPDPDRGS